jgi:hypothetical protein
VLRSAGPTPNSWLIEGPPVPRSVVSATTDSVTGVLLLEVKLIWPLGLSVKLAVEADAGRARVQRVQHVLHGAADREGRR